MYDGTLMKIIYFGMLHRACGPDCMYGWVIGKATLEAYLFTMTLFDVYCRGEIVNHHSHSFLFVSPCVIIVPPCIFVKLNFLESLHYKLSENVYFYTPQI